MNKSTDRRSRCRRCACLLSALLTLAFLASCSADGVQQRTDRRTGLLEKSATNREIRQDARDDRYDAWFDRISD